MDATGTEEPRRLSGWLVIGVLALPLVFSWFTLKRGYSKHVRIGAFLHLALALLVGVARAAT
jgi:cytochrome b